MYAQDGVGLAANQVNLPYRLFVLNLEADPEKGEPFVFINPVISRRKRHRRGRGRLLEFSGNLRAGQKIGIDRHIGIQSGGRGDEPSPGGFLRPGGPARIRPSRRHHDDRTGSRPPRCFRSRSRWPNWSGNIRASSSAGAIPNEQAKRRPAGRIGSVEDVMRILMMGTGTVRRADVSRTAGSRPRSRRVVYLASENASGKTDSRRSVRSESWPMRRTCRFSIPRT